MPNDITVVWNHSIDNISTHEWTQIHGTDIIKSKSFFKANEEAGFDDVKFLYLQVYKRRRAIAIIPCFKYNIDLLRKYLDMFNLDNYLTSHLPSI